MSRARRQRHPAERRPHHDQFAEWASRRLCADFFLLHASVFRNGDAIFNAPGFDNGIVHSGDFGVDIFFILSGFVIAHVYADCVFRMSIGIDERLRWFSCWCHSLPRSCHRRYLPVLGISCPKCFSRALSHASYFGGRFRQMNGRCSALKIMFQRSEATFASPAYSEGSWCWARVCEAFNSTRC